MRWIKAIFNQLRVGEVQLVASSLAFSTILGIIPLIAVMLSFVQYVYGFEQFYGPIENLILSVFKETAGNEAIRTMKYSIRNIHAGTLGTGGALLLLITAMRLLGDMEYGINRVWNIRVRRSFIKRIFVYKLLLILIPVFLGASISIVSYRAKLLATSWIPGDFLIVALMFLFVFLINKLVPNCKVPATHALIGSSLSTVGLILTHKGYVTVAKSFFSYNKIYGAVAALPILLLWLLTIWNVLLAGSALCAAITNESNKNSKIDPQPE